MEEFILYAWEGYRLLGTVSAFWEENGAAKTCFSAIMDVTMFSQSKGCTDLG